MITDKQSTQPFKQTKVTPVENDSVVVIESLRNRCEASPVFNAMCHVFALRERTRKEINIPSLKQAMMKEGFKFTGQQYAEELKFMATLGIGKIKTNKKGRVIALTDVLVTLQSIGLASVNRGRFLTPFKPAPQYKPLTDIFPKETASFVNKPLPKPLPKEEKPSPPVAKADDFQVYLTLVSEGKIIQYDLVPQFSTAELFTLFAKAVRGGK